MGRPRLGALDIDPVDARPFSIHRADDPSLIDTAHVTDDLFGFTNVPMAVWIDEAGTIVRPAEHASVQRSPLRDMEVPEGLPDRLDRLFREVRKLSDQSDEYRAAILDWVEHGSASASRCRPRGDGTVRWAIGRPGPGHGLLRARPAPLAHARGGGRHPLVEEAHALFPENWTYKRQAWTLATTADDAAAPDLIQEAGEVYGTSWLDDVLRLGGGERYYPRGAAACCRAGHPRREIVGTRREVAAGRPDLGSPRREDGEQLFQVVPERVRDRAAHQIRHLLYGLPPGPALLGERARRLRDQAADSSRAPRPSRSSVDHARVRR